MTPLTRMEAKRDVEQEAAYERDVEDGFEGTFVEWLIARCQVAEIPDPSDDVVGDEDIPF